MISFPPRNAFTVRPMRWRDSGPSSDLEDRRGGSGRRARGIGIVGLIVVGLSLVTGRESARDARPRKPDRRWWRGRCDRGARG